MGNDVWYIVQCNPQCEKKAAAEIRRHGYRAYIPKLAKLRVHHRTQEKSVKYQVLYTGYLMIRFPDGGYDDLRSCQGVKRIVKNADGAPYRIKHSIIAGMLRAQRQMENDAAEARTYRQAVRRGSKHSIDRAIAETMFAGVKSGLVVGGAFIGREVEVVGIAENGMIRANVEILGKAVEKLLRPLVEVLPVNEILVESVAEAA